MNGNHHVKPWHGAPRDEICWYPLVESCKCDGCGLCVTSCPSGALAFDFELNLAFAAAPHRCLVGCTTCAMLCPNEAIHLPERSAVLLSDCLKATTEQADAANLPRLAELIGFAMQALCPACRSEVGKKWKEAEDV